MRILSKFIRRVLVQGINSPTDSNSICFVHGLTGNRTTTWTSRSSHGNHQDPFWPNLLANEFPKARVLTYGYDVDVVRLFETTNGNGLRGHSESFLHDLSYARYHNQKRPLFLIAHSLGGLVVEEMLLRALEPDDDSIQAIATSTCGIMFFWNTTPRVRCRSTGQGRCKSRQSVQADQQSNPWPFATELGCPEVCRREVPERDDP
jgi:pimeloyl-ACP methyl ester carboxylesterase